MPLAIAISLVFNFTGGYLLDGVVIQFMAIMFCMAVPLSGVAAASGTKAGLISGFRKPVTQPAQGRLPAALR
jgi:hypothetical protein